jgi:hypothetical protein
MTSEDIIKKALLKARKSNGICADCIYFDDNNIKYNCTFSKTYVVLGEISTCTHYKSA